MVENLSSFHCFLLLFTSLLKVVATYFQEFIRGLDYTLCREQTEKIQQLGLADKLVQSMLDEAANVTPGQAHDFRAFRINWLRVECILSAVSSVVYIDTVKPFVARFNNIVRHSQYGEVLELLEEYVSWKPLWYFAKMVEDEAVKAVNLGIAATPGLQPTRSVVFLKLCKYWSDNVSAHTPEMKPVIGGGCVSLAKTMLERITARILTELNDIAYMYSSFDDQLNDKNAAYEQLRQLKQWKPPKGFVEPTPPGLESDFVNVTRLGKLQEKESVTFQLCSALNSIVTLSIYDTVFTPREFLREKISDYLGQFLSGIAGSENAIHPPTVIEKKISSFCSVFQLVENYVDFDISNVYREVFIKNVWYPQVGDLLKIENSEDTKLIQELKLVDTKSLFKPLVLFYSNFATQRLAATGIVWAPVRLAFVSTKEVKGTSPAENYADICELEALCRVIGPYGIRLLDREILKYIADHYIPLIQNALASNQRSCEVLNDQYLHEGVVDHIKTFKDLDPFINICSALGLTLKFRELMYQALGNVVKQKIPFIHDVVSATFDQYTRNTFMVPDYLSIDLLAKYSGVDVGIADQMLKSYIGKALLRPENGAVLCSNLPAIFAASFVTKFWGEATKCYKANAEAFVNNAHVLTTTIHTLILSSKVYSSPNENLQEIINPLSNFIEISSNLLLRLTKMGSKNYAKIFGTAVTDLGTMYMFLDRFVEESNLLTVEHLENCLPFALMRSMYKQIYDLKVKKNVDLDDL